MNIIEARKKTKDILQKAGIENPAFEALCLIQKVTGLSTIDIRINNDKILSDIEISKLESYAKRRTENEPLQYILGKWSFYGYDFFVGDGVLIPRDDTEIVVNASIEFLKSHKDLSKLKVLDLCAGSGAISIALQKKTNCNLTCVELSDKAFSYLEKNIKLNKAIITAKKADVLLCSDDFSDVSFDLIVSNPPYIKTEDIFELQKEVQKEPKMALDGGKDGLLFYKAIINNFAKKLKIGGALAFELGEDEYDLVHNMMNDNGFDNIVAYYDMSNTKRAIIGIKTTKCS